MMNQVRESSWIVSKRVLSCVICDVVCILDRIQLGDAHQQKVRKVDGGPASPLSLVKYFLHILLLGQVCFRYVQQKYLRQNVFLFENIVINQEFGVHYLEMNPCVFLNEDSKQVKKIIIRVRIRSSTILYHLDKHIPTGTTNIFSIVILLSSYSPINVGKTIINHPPNHHFYR